MKVRKLHRIVGIVLLLPFLGWALTGLVFFIKPGYQSAYEILTPKTYPLETRRSIAAKPDWLEVRYIKTILGDHLLVRTAAGWAQLDPENYQPRVSPNEDGVRRLLKDAFSTNPSRYGEIASVNGMSAITSTGVQVSLEWNRMTFQQTGRDTARIDTLYRIHYLQWSGVKSVDRVVGLVGIGLVLLLSVLGALLAFK